MSGKFVLTNKRKMCRCINPDVYQLRIVIRNIAVDKILIHYEKSNCENDRDNYLFNLTSNDKVYINNVYI